MTTPFVGYQPTLDDYWRAIILFGRNVASYKFALAQALLEMRPAAGKLVSLEDLAEPYSRHLRRHLAEADKQGTSTQSKFLDAIRAANRGDMSDDDLIDATVRLGFINVLDAFHVVGPQVIPLNFFHRVPGSAKGISVTDEFAKLITSSQGAVLEQESEARWRLVETAWELRITRSLLTVSHDPLDSSLFVEDRYLKRKTITSVRSALIGYQKGHCFYCFDDISGIVPDVDHFFPHRLKGSMDRSANIDGVWNLVLACPRCNRGQQGKFGLVPNLQLLARLHTRNEFLIGSQHPLRETLIAQTGAVESDRRGHLNRFHQHATKTLIWDWNPSEVREPLF